MKTRSPSLPELRRRVQASFPGSCATSFIEQSGFDRTLVIASQAFTALIPLLIVTAAVLPGGSDGEVSSAVVRRLNLSGDAAEAVAVVFDSAGTSSVSVFSLLLLGFSGVSLTRRLQRMYLLAWHLPQQGGLSASLNAAMGLAAMLVEFALVSFIRSVTQGLSLGWGLGTPLSLGAGVVLWTLIPWLLVDRRISWRRLLPGGVLAGVCTALYGVATAIYMPRLIELYSDRYGLFGVTIALVSWLVCVSFIVVAATVVAAELDRAPEPWARRLRARLETDSDEQTADMHRNEAM